MMIESESGRGGFAPLTSLPGPSGGVESNAARPPFDDGHAEITLPARVEPPPPIGAASGADGREGVYPVPGRSPEMNERIAGHEAGHCLVSRALGSIVHLVEIIPSGDFAGRCVRSGPPSSLNLETPAPTTDQIVDICARLEKLTPEIGSDRVESSEYYLRAQINIIEMVAGECAELILHPELPPLGAVHDFVEAAAFARVAVAAQPAVKALIEYAEAEATALLKANLDIVNALVEALVEHGTLSGTMVDNIISREVAMRSIRREHQRRAEWHRVEKSAAAFDRLIAAAPSGRR
jgi:hypothetical protein